LYDSGRWRATLGSGTRFAAFPLRGPAGPSDIAVSGSWREKRASSDGVRRMWCDESALAEVCHEDAAVVTRRRSSPSPSRLCRAGASLERNHAHSWIVRSSAAGNWNSRSRSSVAPGHSRRTRQTYLLTGAAVKRRRSQPGEEERERRTYLPSV